MSYDNDIEKKRMEVFDNLHSIATEMAAVLWNLEWLSFTLDDTPWCPQCKGDDPAHEPDCRLAAVLKRWEEVSEG